MSGRVLAEYLTSTSSPTTGDDVLDVMLLDGKAMFDEVDARLCCLLCERQFKSLEHLRRHVRASELHTFNFQHASEQGRVSERASTFMEPAANGESAKRRKVDSAEAGTALHWTLEGAEDGDSGAAGRASAGLSALEQMDLFQKRLQAQDRHRPAETEDANLASIRNARTINQQTDWECSGCKQFNFARSLVCYACKRHVDEETKYLPFGSRVRNLERMAASRLAAPGGEAASIKFQREGESL
uniref:RanBP2-type domain-containing protein n=1 Tax=Calcidiscus leptoporus TaxID=127549 RepID=A0A7S0J3Q0_9EUKA|mmetsp:Transcript_37637/g.88020  ORF Transcript_37637/g.88020 Transcript_37637/m.88020 type:complete len:243 (+) Transcript_37637:68-796(+)|eukprot:CAMPEP_0119364878 /NCGR_PEP_ID=MMETSP1334-20130426/11798_1 /TAXON_ID=127549 /ORGANISM="Calcidiscus leptoporus, Strain RCC1130" /LENGTH=242 /DNA_ID=CAMNT_0007380701 /DNA_START=67 /DNA_END=795 /DNA_ORIENTATION=-